jgi:hypothetical protein
LVVLALSWQVMPDWSIKCICLQKSVIIACHKSPHNGRIRMEDRHRENLQMRFSIVQAQYRIPLKFTTIIVLLNVSPFPPAHSIEAPVRLVLFGLSIRRITQWNRFILPPHSNRLRVLHFSKLVSQLSMSMKDLYFCQAKKLCLWKVVNDRAIAIAMVCLI